MRDDPCGAFTLDANGTRGNESGAGLSARECWKDR
jgi:type IV pilus assembly protein PilE